MIFVVIAARVCQHGIFGGSFADVGAEHAWEPLTQAQTGRAVKSHGIPLFVSVEMDQARVAVIIRCKQEA